MSAVFLNLFGSSKCCVLFSFAITFTKILSLKSTDNWLLFVVNGLGSGALFTSSFVWVMDIWRHNSHALIQTLFFFKSLAIMIMSLVNESENQRNDNVTIVYHIHNFNHYGNSSIEEFAKNMTTNNNEICKVSDICNSFLAICATSLFVIIYDNHKHFKKRSVNLKFKWKITKTILKKLFVTNTQEEIIITLKEQCFFVIASVVLLASLISAEFATTKLLIQYSAHGKFIEHNKLIMISLPLDISINSSTLIMKASQTIMTFILIFVALVLKPKVLLLLVLLITGCSNLSLVLFARNSFAVLLIVRHRRWIAFYVLLRNYPKIFFCNYRVSQKCFYITAKLTLVSYSLQQLWDSCQCIDKSSSATYRGDFWDTL